MLSKKRSEKTKFLRLEKNVTEILVANGRAIEPFVKVFEYEGENIAKESLGTLLGVFEISKRTEDSAYIVNFLASVARKEYFANPRRGAIESFEACLHKVNIALAELVKHGNVEWLGKFEGALGILEKNNLHFSVTGGAKILLLRGENCTDISDGLASEESPLHPMKTFVEVASGHLEVLDQVIFTTPEVFSLLNVEALEKNAIRLGDRFPQFLKTALVNELDMAGVIILSLTEGKTIVAPSPTPKQEKKDSDVLAPAANVFSERAFSASPTLEEAGLHKGEIPEEEKKEYIDSKTGHIYVHGEMGNTGNPHPLLEKLSMKFDEFRSHFQSFSGSQKRFFKKTRKHALIVLDSTREGSLVGARKLWRAGRKLLHKKNVAQEPENESGKISEMPTGTAETKLSRSLSFSSSPLPTESAPPELLAIDQLTTEASAPPAPLKRNEQESSENTSLRSWFHKDSSLQTPPKEPRPKTKEERFERVLVRSASALSLFSVHGKRLGNHLTLFSQKSVPMLRNGIGQSGRILGSASKDMYQKIGKGYQSVPQQFRLPVVGLSLVVICGGIFLLSQSRGNEEVGESIQPSVLESVLSSSLVPDNEKNARLAPAPILIAERGEVALQPLFLNNILYLITTTGVLSVGDKSFYPLPTEAGQAQKAAAMEDLELLFISTENGGLLSWSPITRSYEPNTLSLPQGVALHDIGAYLTYLYVLDNNTDQIYRFPRAAGGFGQPVLWLREVVGVEESSALGVNETLFLSPTNTTLEAYFQGRKTRTLEMPSEPLHVTSLYTKPGSNYIYALDQKNKRLLTWNIDGALVSQLYSEQLGDARALSVNEDNSEAFIATDRKLFSLKLQGNE